MSTVRRIAKNTSVVIAWNIAIKLISFLISIYLARYLGVLGYGNYSFILAYVLSLGVILDLGINNVLIREIAKNKERTEELITNAMGIKLALFAVVLPLSIIIINLLDYPNDVKISAYLAMFAVFFTSNTSILISLFQVDLKMEYPAFADLVSKLFFGILILIIFSQNGGIIRVMIATFASNALALAITYAFARRRLPLKISFDTQVWKEILDPALMIALSGIFATVFIRLDQIILSLLRGNMEVGYYAIPSQLTDAVSLIPLALIASLFPLMSSYSKNSKEALSKTFRLAVKYMFMLSIPMAFGTAILSDRIIVAIYGVAFLPSSPALALMIWEEIFIFCDIVFGNLLVSINQQKKFFIAIVITAVFNVVLNFLLIPYLGFMGAAIAILLSQFLLTLIDFYYLPQFLKTMDTVFIIKSIVASLFMVTFIQYFAMNLYLTIPLAALVYFVILALVGGISGEDFEILKRIGVKT